MIRILEEPLNLLQAHTQSHDARGCLQLVPANTKAEASFIFPVPVPITIGTIGIIGSLLISGGSKRLHPNPVYDTLHDEIIQKKPSKKKLLTTHPPLTESMKNDPTLPADDQHLTIDCQQSIQFMSAASNSTIAYDSPATGKAKSSSIDHQKKNLL